MLVRLQPSVQFLVDSRWYIREIGRVFYFGKLTMKTPYQKLIVALDFKEPFEAFQLVDEVSDYIDWFKIGPVLFTYSGNKIISFLHQRRKKIFLDLKLYDTPQVVGDTLKKISEMGIRMASIHCMGGHKMLEAAAEGCRGSSVELLGLTLLTSRQANLGKY